MPTKTTARAASRRKRKPSCDDCYFRAQMLCALEVPEPCATFRDRAEGLRPPRQLSFVFRHERPRTAWVFDRAA